MNANCFIFSLKEAKNRLRLDYTCEMKKTVYCFILVTLVLLAACSSSKKIAELQFGSWGGVTGKALNYAMTNEGKVFKTEASGTKTQQLYTLKPDELKDVMALLSKISYKKVAAEAPGNMNYFINFKTSKQTYISQWESGKSHMKLDELHLLLMKFTSKK